MVNNMQPTGEEKPSVKSTLTNFIAAPFMMAAWCCLWIATLITGNSHFLIEVEDIDDWRQPALMVAVVATYSSNYKYRA